MSATRTREFDVGEGNEHDVCPRCGIWRKNAGYTKDSCGPHFRRPGCLVKVADGMLVRISVEGDGYMVRDFIGLRYGFANNVPQAVEMWAHDVQFLISEPREKLGGPLLDEADAYRKAMPHG